MPNNPADTVNLKPVLRICLKEGVIFQRRSYAVKGGCAMAVKRLKQGELPRYIIGFFSATFREFRDTGFQFSLLEVGEDFA